MADCLACGRPVAVPRPQCFYCGAALPAAPVADEASPSGSATPANATTASTTDRLVLVLDLRAVLADTIAAALGLSAYEAGQRVRRGGFQLHRVLERSQAGSESERLRGLGLHVIDVPETEVRSGSQPWVARGGRFADGVLTLRDERGEIAIGGGDLRLLVKGPIARSYQTSPDPKRLRTATLEQGYRFHLWRAGTEPPIELDPAAFEFADLAGRAESSLLQLTAWVGALAASGPVDDGFRLEPPALGAAAEPTGLEAALGRRERRAKADKEGTLILDNLRQFRFYSAWRGAAARRASG